MNSICSPEMCTMCHACAAICPKECITDKRTRSAWYMCIQEDTCIKCNRCKQVCPNISPPTFHEPKHLFAAWSCDDVFRKQSASGGIASSLYAWAVDHGLYICGVTLDESFMARYIVSNSRAIITDFSGSKYTYSDPSKIHEPICKLLLNGNGVLFTGLPCHVAGVLNYLKIQKCPIDNFYAIDLVCHGTPFPDYLAQHIGAVSRQHGITPFRVYFRDPHYHSKNYAFSIYDQGINIPNVSNPRYKKYVLDDDVYQIGYHGAYIYRDNCYHCAFSRHQRVGDITLFDSGGLGKRKLFLKTKDDTSFVLVNTQKGQLLLDAAKSDGKIHLENRPIDEAYDYNAQLNTSCTTMNSKYRNELLNNIDNGMAFDEAASIAFQDIIKKNRSYTARVKRVMRRLIRGCLPNFMVDAPHILNAKRQRKNNHDG